MAIYQRGDGRTSNTGEYLVGGFTHEAVAQDDGIVAHLGRVDQPSQRHGGGEERARSGGEGIDAGGIVNGR